MAEWHTFYGSNLEDQGHSIVAVEADGVYVAGYSRDWWAGDHGAVPKHTYADIFDLAVIKLASAHTNYMPLICR